MVVDVHAHVIVPEVTREVAPHEPWRPSVRWEEGRQVVEFGGKAIRSAVGEFVWVERIVEQEAERGVDHVVLSPWVQLLPYELPVEEALGVCRLQNEGLARAAQAHPGRVSAVGALPLQDPELSARELAGLLALPGVRGVEVAASVAGAYLGHDRFEPFWEAAEALGAVVFVHPTTRGFDLPVFEDYYLWNTVGNPLETAATAAHLVMAGVLERHPGLRVVLAHGGGALMAVRGRLRHAHRFQPQARSRLSEPPDGSLRRLHYDTVTHDLDLLRELVAYVGPDHVLLGSDHPFDMGSERPVEEVRALGLDPAQEALVLGGNAARLFGLEGDP
ncbi:MAG TPA: amidohydrolase family protein [Actinomycetota bacterium]|nr:amidohydrolase family protein [Actinomycetota bacterium]